MPSQLIVSAIVVGSAYGLLAASFSLICHTARFFHIAHGAIYTVGAYALYAVTSQTAIGWPLAILISVAGASLLGCATYWAIYRPLKLRESTPTVLLLASLALLIVLQSVIALWFGSATLKFNFLNSNPIYEVFGARITAVQLVILLTCSVLTGLLLLWLSNSRIGTKLRAIANDEDLAHISGINIDLLMSASFAIGSALAAITAVLVALDTDLTPQMGFRAIIIGIVAAIFGGVGNIAGAFLAGIFIGIIQNLAVWYLPGQWQDTIVYAILLLILLLRPHGLLGKSP